MCTGIPVFGIYAFCRVAFCEFVRLSQDIEFYRYNDWNNNDFIIVLLWFGGKNESY